MPEPPLHTSWQLVVPPIAFGVSDIGQSNTDEFPMEWNCYWNGCKFVTLCLRLSMTSGPFLAVIAQHPSLGTQGLPACKKEDSRGQMP